MIEERANQDLVRWRQRFADYQRALVRLRQYEAMEMLNDREEEGMVRAFECTFEQAWNLMRDYFAYSQAWVNVANSRDAIMTAHRQKLIGSRKGWEAMDVARKQSHRIYEKETFGAVVKAIRRRYLPLFGTLEKRMKKLMI
jgi:nucleotidyltransferase substrate binding protein (TIGR01987 family)